MEKSIHGEAVRRRFDPADGAGRRPRKTGPDGGIGRAGRMLLRFVSKGTASRCFDCGPLVQ
jgi:hypothetical protein